MDTASSRLNTRLLQVYNVPFLLGSRRVLTIASVHPLEDHSCHPAIQLCFLFQVILKEALRTFAQYTIRRKLLGALRHVRGNLAGGLDAGRLLRRSVRGHFGDHKR